MCGYARVACYGILRTRPCPPDDRTSIVPPTSVDHVYAAIGESKDNVGALLESVRNGSAFRSRESRGHTIYTPAPWWGSVSKELNRFLASRIDYPTPDHVYGFVKGRSTLDNAWNHLHQNCVLRIDIQSFFPSIEQRRIAEVLQRFDFAPDAAELVAQLVTVGGGLAIGLSPSPFISNLVMIDTDRDLQEFAERNQLIFTRYVDDMVFSGEIPTRTEGDRVAESVEDILVGHGWTVNRSKTAFMRRGGPQYVTGLYVGADDRPHAPRELKRTLRWITRMIERHGYDTYMRDFSGDEYGHYRRRLLGTARYVASIDGRVGVSLLQRLDAALPEYDEREYDEEFYDVLDEFDW